MLTSYIREDLLTFTFVFSKSIPVFVLRMRHYISLALYSSASIFAWAFGSFFYSTLVNLCLCLTLLTRALSSPHNASSQRLERANTFDHIKAAAKELDRRMALRQIHMERGHSCHETTTRGVARLELVVLGAELCIAR